MYFGIDLISYNYRLLLVKSLFSDTKNLNLPKFLLTEVSSSLVSLYFYINFHNSFNTTCLMSVLRFSCTFSSLNTYCKKILFLTFIHC
jgi:hypothetical protein